MSEREIATDDNLLKFLISDPLEEHRVQTLLTKEPETIFWINSWSSFGAATPLCFWDIGANIGIYALYAAAKHPQLQVVAFEPFFRNFVRLKANIALNALSNITPLYVALSDRSGPINFCVQDERFGASGNVVVPDHPCQDRAPAKSGASATDRMLQVSGDDLLALHFDPPNFVKIDVDGIESSIIEGMLGLLGHEALKSILVEINSKQDLEVIRPLVARHGLVPDDNFNLLENHSARRRRTDPKNTAENWVFTKV